MMRMPDLDPEMLRALMGGDGALPQTGFVPDNPNAALQGSQTSAGPVAALVDAQTRALLRARRQSGVPGLASVMIHCYDREIVLAGTGESEPGPANQRVLVDVRWKTELGGGDATIDATRGAIFTVGGSSAVELDVRIVRATAALPFGGRDLSLGARMPLISKWVEATVHWNGSVSPKAARMTDEAVDLIAGAPSAKFPIPAFAESFLALSDVAAQLPNLRVDFLSDIAYGSRTIFQTTNPNANGTPIVGGAEGYRLYNGVANMTVIPTWELWL